MFHEVHATFTARGTAVAFVFVGHDDTDKRDQREKVVSSGLSVTKYRARATTSRIVALSGLDSERRGVAEGEGTARQHPRRCVARTPHS